MQRIGTIAWMLVCAVMGCEGDEDEGDVRWESDTCHYDCFGGASCSEGVVRRYAYGAKPCSLGPGCHTGETYTCPGDCKVFADGDPYPNPYPDTPLSEYCADAD